ncbi:MAG: hypothetical protein AAF825_03875 [Pseudomonadota bacterium]
MSIFHPEALFFEEARQLSISARFGLAMCFLNEFCHRFSISGEALNQYREHTRKCPLLDGKGDFSLWLSKEPHIVSDGISESQNFGLNGISSLTPTDFANLAKIFDLTYSVLKINFWGAGEKEGTLELLAMVAELARPSILPATTPFKFSSIRDDDGWGDALIASDLLFWRTYRENWFRLEGAGS